MDTLFPFNLPAPTLGYILLYIVTLLMHVAFMSYVLGGSIILCVAELRKLFGMTAAGSAWHQVTVVLKDWMPFALSAAITAGIGPLLFVQILYQQPFYTANLLSFHRWMAILPVLIIAFYLLYLLKARLIAGRVGLQAAVATVVMGCVLFVGWSWIENHLLSLDEPIWSRQYESRAIFYANPAILPRMAFWITGALPLASLLLAWQLIAGASGVDASSGTRAARHLAILSLIMLVSAAALAWPVLRATPTMAAQPSHAALAPWLWLAMVGSAITVTGWVRIFLASCLSRSALAFATIGSVLFWSGVLTAREAARWAVCGTPAALARHAQVGTLSGIVVFLVFFVIGIGTVAWVVRTVARFKSAK